MTDRWIVSTPFRVRYVDTDQMGVVHHARYFELFEVGRTEWIRSCLKSYRAMEEDGVFLPLVHACATFRKSFTYDEIIHIQCFPIGYSQARIRFGYELMSEHDASPRVTGITEHAFIDANGKTIRMPETLVELLRHRVSNQLLTLFSKPLDKS